MKFGDRIKLLREEMDISRDDLAKKIGVTYHAMSKYEISEREPDFELLNKLAKFFNVSVDYLLGRTSIRNSNLDDSSEIEIEELLKKSNVQFDGVPLDEEDKEDLLEFIKVAWKQINKRK
ncbi:MAG: hypothetical protein VR72_02835 [Clostridiaceae bacterium BRH_c20a]|nr:MAG: hypothetical protein VR72_02835 [Clostridiaceae bacterium BRH_c20a]